MDKARSRLARGRIPYLPDAVFLYCLNVFWDDFARNQSTMSFENVAFAPGSPGRAFLLDEDDLVGRLERLERASDGSMVWSETAGLRQIIRQKSRKIKTERRRLREGLQSSRQQVAA